MNLTREQQLMLAGFLLLLMLGWAVKTWRTAHPPGNGQVPAARVGYIHASG